MEKDEWKSSGLNIFYDRSNLHCSFDAGDVFCCGLISVAYVISLGCLRQKPNSFENFVCTTRHLPRFWVIEIEALSIIDRCGRDNFRVESHVFAGEEFESKWRLYKFPWVKPICFPEYFHISRDLFLFDCVSMSGAQPDKVFKMLRVRQSVFCRCRFNTDRNKKKNVWYVLLDH